MFSAGHILQPRSKTDLLTLEHGIATGPVNRATFQSAGPRAGLEKLEDCTVSVVPLLTSLVLFCVSTMSCNEDEESMNAPDQEPPCTPPKQTGNGGACRVDPDGQMESKDDDSHDLQVAKPERKWNGRMEWTVMKRWVTGEKAEMEQEDIDSDSELFELAREWMCVSKLQVRNLPGHAAKETDVALCHI
jgi:hypothetical protein